MAMDGKLPCLLLGLALLGCDGETSGGTDNHGGGGTTLASGGVTSTSSGGNAGAVSSGGTSTTTGVGTSSAALTDVTGAWCGLEVQAASDCVGDSVVYAELTQTNGAVTGQSCEAYEKDCYAIENGAFSDSKLEYSYQFDGYQVDMTLTTEGSAVLTGTAYSSKCACEIPITLHKIP